MKGYLNYLLRNLKNGNYVTGLLMFLTLIIFLMILTVGSTIQNRYIDGISILWLLISGAICISWNSYWYDIRDK